MSVTYTINGLFGAKVIAGDTGIFLNNEMDDFTTRPAAPNMFGLVQGEKNAVAPGKRPLSSMSPTIVTKDGKLFMVTGSRGGPRIISTTVGTIMNVVDYGMNLQEAVNAPRIHHQWLPDQIFLEPMALSPDTRALLESRGHKLVDGNAWGGVAAIIALPDESEPDGIMLYGANDDRHPGRRGGGALKPGRAGNDCRVTPLSCRAAWRVRLGVPPSAFFPRSHSPKVESLEANMSIRFLRHVTFAGAAALVLGGATSACAEDRELAEATDFTGTFMYLGAERSRARVRGSAER